MDKLKVLDLFSGIGGFSLGLERAGMETVAFCEIEDYPRRVLKKHWPEVPCYSDVRELTAERLKHDGIGSIDVICGGYPCQPFSIAGKRRGEEDDRHLWPEYLRLIRELRPRWIIGENVAGHINMGIDNVLSDLEGEGYAWEAFVIPACAVNAIHRRDRVWIVAHPNELANGKQYEHEAQRHDSKRAFRALPHANEVRRGSIDHCEGVQAKACGRVRSKPPADCSGRNDPVAIRARLQRCVGSREAREEGAPDGHSAKCSSSIRSQPIELPTQSPICHRDDGVPDRVARLKALGNAVVPQIPEIIGRAIIEMNHG